MALGRDASKNLVQVMTNIKERLGPDITIRCGSMEFRFHSVVLENASAFWKTVCNGSFKESHTGAIKLIEDDPRAVEAFIEALYECNYGKEVKLDKSIFSDAWELHVQVY